jgi:multiple sugar transport system substrate-binding protein
MFKRCVQIAAIAVLTQASLGCHKAADPNTVRFRFWGDLEEVKIIDGLIHDFETANPGIHVKAERKPDPATYADNLMTEFASGSAPDVIFVDTDRFDVLAEGGKFADLDAFLSKDPALKAADYYPAMIRRFTQGGALRVLPRDIAPIACVYYNKSLFDAAKLPYPKDGWTWDDLRKDALALTQRDAEGHATQLGFADDWNLTDAWVLAGGGGTVDDYAHPTRFTFAEGGALDGLLFRWRLLQVDHVMPSSSENKTLGGGGMASFINGDLALFHSGIWKTPTFRRITAFQWDVAPFPRKAGVAKPRYWSGGSGYAMRQGAANPEACWKLIRFMAGPDGQRRMAATGLAQPALMAMAESPAFLDGQDPKNKKMLLACAQAAQPGPSWTKWSEFARTVYGPATDAIWIKDYQGDPKATLQALQQKANDLYFNRH